MVQEAVRASLVAMGITDTNKKLVIPDSVLATELTVLGAATMLPGYEYTIDAGLQRVVE
jgi:hypothetical protein